MDEVTLTINGVSYAGWTGVRISRSIESISGAFEVRYTERYPGQPQRRPIKPGDAVEVRIGDDQVVTGYVDRVAAAADSRRHELAFAGRDRAADLIDSAPDLPPNEWNDITVFEFAQLLARPYGIPIRNEAPIGRRIPKVALNPGDTAWQLLEQLARHEAILPVSDGLGGIVFTRAGTARADTALVEGENVLELALELDDSERFSEYIVKSSLQGSDLLSGELAAFPEGRARDAQIKRYRPLTVVSSIGADSAQCLDRAKWEVSVRAGRGARAIVSVQGWRSGGGRLWPLNALVALRSPTLGIDQEMLIAEIEYSLDEGGAVTRLGLVRKEAFELIPEPAFELQSLDLYFQDPDNDAGVEELG